MTPEEHIALAMEIAAKVGPRSAAAKALHELALTGAFGGGYRLALSDPDHSVGRWLVVPQGGE